MTLYYHDESSRVKNNFGSGGGGMNEEDFEQQKREMSLIEKKRLQWSKEKADQTEWFPFGKHQQHFKKNNDTVSAQQQQQRRRRTVSDLSTENTTSNRTTNGGTDQCHNPTIATCTSTSSSNAANEENFSSTSHYSPDFCDTSSTSNGQKKSGGKEQRAPNNNKNQDFDLPQTQRLNMVLTSSPEQQIHTPAIVQVQFVPNSGFGGGASAATSGFIVPFRSVVHQEQQQQHSPSSSSFVPHHHLNGFQQLPTKNVYRPQHLPHPQYSVGTMNTDNFQDQEIHNNNYTEQWTSQLPHWQHVEYANSNGITNGNLTANDNNYVNNSNVSVLSTVGPYQFLVNNDRGGIMNNENANFTILSSSGPYVSPSTYLLNSTRSAKIIMTYNKRNY